MYVGVHLGVCYFCLIFTKIELGLHIIMKSLKYEISRKSVRWESQCSMSTDGRTGHGEAKYPFSVHFQHFADRWEPEIAHCDKWLGTRYS